MADPRDTFIDFFPFDSGREAIIAAAAKQADVQVEAEDETCEITCDCGTKLWIGGEQIHWCLACGRGYRSRLTIETVPLSLLPTEAQLDDMIAYERQGVENMKALAVQPMFESICRDTMRWHEERIAEIERVKPIIAALRPAPQAENAQS